MRAFLVGAIVASVVACGGNVVVDGMSAVGGSVATGGMMGGMPTTSTTTSTVSGSSSSSSSVVSSSSSGSPACPSPFPGIEATCTSEGLACSVPGACCAGKAVCLNGFWKYLPVPCMQSCTLTCGPDGFTCDGGLACVTYIGMTTVYQCAPNPCAGALSCSCAASLCAEEGMMCNNIQMGFKVLCD
jgi:hypothetical protein